jgi:CHAD domain-containing protein
LNTDKKTIGVLFWSEVKIWDKNKFKSVDPIVQIQSVRGYATEVRAVLKKTQLQRIALSTNDLLHRCLAVTDRQPADYSSKYSVELKPNMTASAALKKIYLNLLYIIKLNENGIIKDIDTEFLHDFRVSVRRTRSGLGQIKGFLDKAITNQAKIDFALLGRSTNKLRDIDVYLLKENDYIDLLPPGMIDKLNPFFDELRKNRKNEHRALVTVLKSSKYRQILSDWENFLHAPSNDHSSSRKQEIKIPELAKKVIYKRNQKVIQFGREILKTQSDELLHQLRIEGKKLRYLLEFFSSLFPTEKIQFLIQHLKQLQENLGDFNDLVIQQDTLHKAAVHVSLRGKHNKETILTLGVLIGKLDEKQRLVKKSFARTFRVYASAAVQQRFNELFMIRKRGVK